MTVKASGGIKASAFSDLQNSIETYITTVKRATVISASDATIRDAIKGTSAEANVKKIIAEYQEEMRGFMDKLATFKETLANLEINYKKNDENSFATRTVSTGTTTK